MSVTRSGGGAILFAAAMIVVCLFFLVVAQSGKLLDFDLPQQSEVVILDTRAGSKIVSDGVEIEYQAHAESHGAEANFARDCFEQNGSIAMFKLNQRDYARMCVLEDGYVALQFLVYIAEKKYIEASSYIPHPVDSSVAGVKEWLMRTGWVVFNGPLP